jgi:hypothetical protein
MYQRGELAHNKEVKDLVLLRGYVVRSTDGMHHIRMLPEKVPSRPSDMLCGPCYMELAYHLSIDPSRSNTASCFMIPPPTGQEELQMNELDVNVLIYGTSTLLDVELSCTPQALDQANSRITQMWVGV